MTQAAGQVGVDGTPIGAGPRNSGRTLALAVLISTVSLDQSVKLAVTVWLGPNSAEQRWELAGRFLAFEYVENRGAAFGLFAGQTLFLALAAVAAALILWTGLARTTARSKVAAIGLGLVVGGALGNLIDRVRLGYVVDFFAVGIWPKFNVADSAITIGLILLGWYALDGHAREQQSERNDKHPN